MINYNEAYKIVLNEISNIKLSKEKIPLIESIGRIASDNIRSGIELPAFNNSAMDGIGIRYRGNISKWKITGEISAGHFKNESIQDDESLLIMTGARVPDFVDTVIPFEDVIITNGFAELKSPGSVKKNQNIRYKGKELSPNDHILKKGILIKPANIPILAACGFEYINVYRKLNFGIFATGDELIKINETPHDDKIRASNLYSIISMIKNFGMNYDNSGIIRDDKNALKSTILSMMDGNCDIIISSGGVSAGMYDHIPDILKELEFTILFWKVNIKPGKPILFAKKEYNNKEILYFGLPGNPVSAFMNFSIFIQRSILEVFSNYSQPLKEVILSENISKNDNKRHFVRGYVKNNNGNGIPEFSTYKNQSSSNMKVLNNSNALLILEENSVNPKKGEYYKCIMM
jgi:molybdopterin molybdotransferase